MKKVITYILIAIFIIVCSIILSKLLRPKVSNADSTVHKGLYVDGTTLRHSNGEAFVMQGINHAHSWFRGLDETALDAIADTGANTVRIVLSCGIQWQKDDADTLKNIIELAHAKGLIVIVEVHDGTGSNSRDILNQIGDYWCEMASILKGTEEYCILNIANEWVGSWNPFVWSEGYVSVIPLLREAGIENVLMVDAAGWGQCGVAIDLFGKKVFDADPCKNTMFSIHMYGISGGHNWTIRYNLKAATEQNLCICVGEFGYIHTDGDVKEDYLMEYCKKQQIGYLAWSWKGNSGGVEYLDLAKEWDGSKLSEWGQKVVDSFQ